MFYHPNGQPVDLELEAKHLDGLIHYLRQLHEDVLPRSMENSVKILLGTLPFFGNLRAEKKFPRVLRLTNSSGRLRNERVTQIADLKSPPREIVTWYNRCYMPGESMFYGAFDPMTLVEEICPQTNDLVTISTWELISDYRITYCPVFQNQPAVSYNLLTEHYKMLQYVKTMEFPVELRPMIESLSRFVAYTFTRPCPSKNDMEYFFCGYFASRMLNDMGVDNAEAILYPSVKAGLTRQNIAIKPEVIDNHYKLVKVEEYIVGSSLRYSDEAIIIHGSQVCEHFDYEKGTILWD